MKKIKLSRLCRVVMFGLCVQFMFCGVRGVSLCTKISMELGLSEFDTICDLDFCTCRDPFGKVKCVCPAEDPEEEIIVKSKGSCSVSPDITSLSLENCKKVTVVKEAFDEDVKALQNLEFINVEEVSIEGRIFASNGASCNVHFKNSTVPDVPSFAFSGNIESVLFESCYLGIIRAFAFSSIHGADQIVFRDSTVVHVEAQSFKKFAVNKFIIVGGRFDVIPSRFVADVAVETLFKIESTYIEEIRTLGFKIFNPKKVLLINSIINKLREESFKIVTKGEVVMESNVLNGIENEAFRGVTVDKYVILQNGKQKFKFQNQTVTNLEDKSLYINRSVFEVQMGKLVIEESCTCDGLILWKEVITNGKEVLAPLEIELEPIWCRVDTIGNGEPDSKNYAPGREFYKNHCTKLTSSVYFFVIIITATTVGILFVIIVITCVIRRRKKWKPVPSSAREPRRKDQRELKGKKKGRKKHVAGDKPEATKAIIVPDGRTYKETEFHIIVEKAEPLDEECISYTVVRDRSHSQMNQSNNRA